MGKTIDNGSIMRQFPQEMFLSDTFVCLHAFGA